MRVHHYPVGRGVAIAGADNWLVARHTERAVDRRRQVAIVAHAVVDRYINQVMIRRPQHRWIGRGIDYGRRLGAASRKYRQASEIVCGREAIWHSIACAVEEEARDS